MQIDGALVDPQGGGGAIHLANQAGLALAHVLDHDPIIPSGAEADLGGRIGAPDPLPFVGGGMIDLALLAEGLEQGVHLLLPKGFPRLKREFKGRAAQVVREDGQIVRIDAPVLRGGLQQVARIAGQELIQGCG